MSNTVDFNQQISKNDNLKTKHIIFFFKDDVITSDSCILRLADHSFTAKNKAPARSADGRCHSLAAPHDPQALNSDTNPNPLPPTAAETGDLAAAREDEAEIELEWNRGTERIRGPQRSWLSLNQFYQQTKPLDLERFLGWVRGVRASGYRE